MAASRAEKEHELQDLASAFKGANTAILVDYRGLNVPAVTELRRQIRGAKLTAQLRDLRDVQALVVHQNRRLGRLEGRRQVPELQLFFRSCDSHRSLLMLLPLVDVRGVDRDTRAHRGGHGD